jgi:hypothetical protein
MIGGNGPSVDSKLLHQPDLLVEHGELAGDGRVEHGVADDRAGGEINAIR